MSDKNKYMKMIDQIVDVNDVKGDTAKIIFEAIREKNNDVISYIEKTHGLEMKNAIVKRIKEMNKGYFCFDFYREKPMEYSWVLIDVFKNMIIKYDFDKVNILIAKLHEVLSDDEVKTTGKELSSLVEFLIEKNYSNSSMKRILEDFYDLDCEYLTELFDLFDANIMLLKLNYIIKILSKDNKEY